MESSELAMDVDTGVDDALALLLAWSHWGSALRGITTTTGNVSSLQAMHNTRWLLDSIGGDDLPPVMAGPNGGQERGLSVDARHIHGPDGLGGASGQVDPREERDRSTEAIDFLAGLTRENAAGVSLVATAPLTNLAAACRAHPSSFASIGGAFIMAGAIDRPGNIRPHAEFNAFVNPSALDHVLRTLPRCHLFPLNVTEQVRLLRSDLAAAKDIDTEIRALLLHFTSAYMAFHERRYGFDGCFLHDVLPVACTVEPSLFGFEELRVEVDLPDSATPGRTRQSADGAAVQVAVSVDAGGVVDLLLRHLGRLRAASAGREPGAPRFGS